MADNDRKLTAAEAEQVLARAASLDSQGEAGLSAEDIRQSALAAGIAPHAVDRALSEARGPSPALAAPSGRFAGLPAIPRAQARVATPTPPSVAEIAAKLRLALITDTRISEEFGTVRARFGETTVTVVPGASTLVAVSSDHAAAVAVTGIAAGAGGAIGGLMFSLLIGASSSTVGVLACLAGGFAAGIMGWQVFWRQYLARKEREMDRLAASVAGSLERG